MIPLRSCLGNQAVLRHPDAPFFLLLPSDAAVSEVTELFAAMVRNAASSLLASLLCPPGAKTVADFNAAELLRLDCNVFYTYASRCDFAHLVFYENMHHAFAVGTMVFMPYLHHDYTMTVSISSEFNQAINHVLSASCRSIAVHMYPMIL